VEPHDLSDSQSLRSILLLLAVISIAFLAVYHPALSARMDSQDDQEILYHTQRVNYDSKTPEILQLTGPLWVETVRNDLEVGRFRPVYYMLRLAQAGLWGLDMRAWHATRLLLGILTCLLLFLAARSGGLGRAPSALFVAWTALQGAGAEVWARAAPAETYGVLFFSLALLALVKAARPASGTWDWIAVGSAALMGLSKENFILTIPVLLAFRVGLESGFDLAKVKSVTLSARKPLTVAMAVFIAELGVVTWTYLQGGHGQMVVDRVGNPYSPAVWAELLWMARARFAWYAPIAAVLFVAAHDRIRGRKGGAKVLWLGLLGAGLVAPQLTLLEPMMVESRYFYPAAIALAGVSAAALRGLEDRKLLQRAIVVLCVVLTFPLALRTHAMARQFAGRTIVLNETLDYVAANTPPGRVIVLYAQPVRRFEAAITIVRYLRLRQSTAPVYIHFTGDYDPGNQLVNLLLGSEFRDRLDTSSVDSATLARLRKTVGDPLGTDLQAGDAGALMLMESEAEFEKDPPAWYDPERSAARDFKEPRYQAGGFRLVLGPPLSSTVRMIR